MNCYAFLGKDNEGISCFLLHGFEFRVILFNFLPPKAQELSLLFKTHASLKTVGVNVNTADKVAIWTWLIDFIFPATTFSVGHKQCHLHVLSRLWQIINLVDSLKQTWKCPCHTCLFAWYEFCSFSVSIQVIFSQYKLPIVCSHFIAQQRVSDYFWHALSIQVSD